MVEGRKVVDADNPQAQSVRSVFGEDQVLKEPEAKPTTVQMVLLELFGLETQDNSQAHELATNNLS